MNIGAFEEDIKEILAFGDIYKSEMTFEKITNYNTQIEQFEDEMNTLSAQELMLFGFKSSYDSFFNLKKFFAPHYELWLAVSQFMTHKVKWTYTKLNQIDADEVENMVKTSAKSIEKLKKKFDDKLLANRVLHVLDKEV